jgi:3D (Asp-Asp-Asp) domain-containing protein
MKYEGAKNILKQGMSKRKAIIVSIIAFTLLSASLVVGFKEYYRLSYAKDLKELQTSYLNEYKEKETILNQQLLRAQNSVRDLQMQIADVTSDKEKSLSLSASKQSNLYAKSQSLENEKESMEAQIKQLKYDKYLLSQKVSRLYQQNVDYKRTKLLNTSTTSVSSDSDSVSGSSSTTSFNQHISNEPAPVVSNDIKTIRKYTTSQNVEDKPMPEDAVWVEATAYTADCAGCIGITKTGIDIRSSTPNIIAVDKSWVPLGSDVDVWVGGKYFGRFKAEDTGGDIKGTRIDVLRASDADAVDFGRKNAHIKIVK